MIKHKIILIFLLLVITSFAFFPCLKNDFVNWDDRAYVTENSMITDLSLKNIKNIFTSYHQSNYHPLALLSYSIEYRFFKLNPRAYHTTSLIFHLLNLTLVFWLIFILSGGFFISFIVALLFAIHPFHVESVAWISARRDVLYSFFFLGASISYLYYKKNQFKKYYYFALFLFLLSLLSKAMAITLPLVLILFDYLSGYKLDWKALKEKIPFFGLSFIFGIISFFARYLSKDMDIKEQQILTPLFLIGTSCYELLFYLFKTAIPIKFSCLYPSSKQIYVDQFVIFLSSPFIILILIALVVLSKKYTKKVIFGSLFFLVTIFPILQIIPTVGGGKSVAYDRYTYIPLIGLFYIMAEGFSIYIKNLNKIGKNFLLITLIAVTTILFFLTQKRCEIWKDGIILWDNVLKNYPNVFTASFIYYNRGYAYMNKEKYDMAISDFNSAIDIKPDYADAYNNCGFVYWKMREYDKAISNFTQTLNIDLKHIQAYINRGAVYYTKREYDKAISDFNRVLNIDQNCAKAYYNRGNVYKTRGEYNLAILDYNQAININSNYAGAYNNRGFVYWKIKEYDKAISDFTQTLKIEREHSDITHGLKIDWDYVNIANLYINRGFVYYLKGEYKKAVEDYTEALKINPNNPNVYYNRVNTYFKNGEYNNAWKDIQIINKLGYKIDPKFLKILSEKVKKENEIN